MIIHQYMSGQTSTCPSSLLVIENLQNELKRIEIISDDSPGGMTKRLISALEPYLLDAGWTARWPIDRSVSHDGYASFFIDYHLDEDAKDCGHYHRFFLQLMFDNRQAIGTNLLKFEIASRNSIMNGRMPTCIAICAEDSKVKKLGWDGAAASSQEYLGAIAGPYANVLTSPPIIFSIDRVSNL